MAYLDEVKKKFDRFIMLVDRASQHRSKIVKRYLQRNSDNLKIDYFPVGSSEFNPVEECWKQSSIAYYPAVILISPMLNINYFTTTEQEDLI